MNNKEKRTNQLKTKKIEFEDGRNSTNEENVKWNHRKFQTSFKLINNTKRLIKPLWNSNTMHQQSKEHKKPTEIEHFSRTDRTTKSHIRNMDSLLWAALDSRSKWNKIKSPISYITMYTKYVHFLRSWLVNVHHSGGKRNEYDKTNSFWRVCQ